VGREVLGERRRAGHRAHRDTAEPTLADRWNHAPADGGGTVAVLAGTPLVFGSFLVIAGHSGKKPARRL